MSNAIRPEGHDQVVDAVREAVAARAPLEVVGRATKRGLGHPTAADLGRLDLSALSGITMYEPDELVLSARAATPMAEIEKALTEARQEMAFEPPDLGPLLGADGAGTLGGAIACNLGGPRRIKAGAARDHFLGFAAVSGRGETFKSGGRVMKNVTGFDLSKLMAGSFGTLAVMTEVTIKVLPAAEKTRSVLLLGLDDARAIEALSEALGSAHEVSAAAHLPAAVARASGVAYVRDAGGSVAAIRVEGPGPSVDYRCAALRQSLAKFGPTEELHSQNSRILWREVRDVAYFAADRERQVWRLSVPPSDGARVAEEILAVLNGHAYYDWGGGLVWLSIAPRPDAGADTVRHAVAAAGGHATLFRAAESVRGQVPVFEPHPPTLAALSARIKKNFDPEGVLNPGRMYWGI